MFPQLVIAEWPLYLTLGGFYIAWFAVAGNDFTKVGGGNGWQLISQHDCMYISVSRLQTWVRHEAGGGNGYGPPSNGDRGRCRQGGLPAP